MKITDPTEARRVDMYASPQEMLQNTDFVVEATRFEESALWNSHHEKRKWSGSSSGGYLLTIGRLNDLPVALSTMFHRIDGYLVMFYHASSRMVDYTMVDEWLEKNVRVLQPGQAARARCDADNFHHCLHHLTALDAAADAALASAIAA